MSGDLIDSGEECKATTKNVVQLIRINCRKDTWNELSQLVRTREILSLTRSVEAEQLPQSASIYEDDVSQEISHLCIVYPHWSGLRRESLVDYTPIKAKNFTQGKKVRFVQAKKDGHRVTIYVDDREERKRIGGIKCMTKTGIDISEKLHRLDKVWSPIVKLPSGTVVDAELYADNVQATEVKTLINKKDLRLKLSGFALPYHRGHPVDSMVDAFTCLHQLGLNPPEIVEDYGSLIEVTADDVNYWLRLAVDLKIEGFVLKESHLRGWWKLKPTKTVDAFVTGTTKSFSALHYGGIQGFNVSLLDADNNPVDMGNVGSGFTAKLRQLDPKQFIGKVMEIQYDSLAAKGKLKFPRFVRWREDKLMEECSVDQL